jgi:hypothetical protein
MASSKEKPRSKKKHRMKQSGPGRPPKDDEERLLVIGTRVSPRVYKLLKRKADAGQMSIGHLLRDICDNSVKKKVA